MTATQSTTICHGGQIEPNRHMDVAYEVVVSVYHNHKGKELVAVKLWKQEAEEIELHPEPRQLT